MKKMTFIFCQLQFNFYSIIYHIYGIHQMQLVNYFVNVPTNIINEIVLMFRETHMRWNNFDIRQMANRTNNKPTNVNEYDINSDGPNNKSVNSDLYQAMFPIYHLSKLSGIFPTRFVGQVSGRYQGQLSVTDCVYSVCLLMCIIGAQIWGFWHDLKDGREHSTRFKSQNSVIVTICDVMCLKSLTAVSIISSILCWKHVQTIINKLIDCDEKLGIVSPKKMRRYTILLILCSLLYCISLSCLDFYTWNYEMKLKKLNDKGPNNYLPLYFMWIVIITMQVQYAVVTYNVCQRFCRLNKNIENILKRGRITNQFRKDLGLAGDLRNQGQLTYIRQDMGNIRMFRKSKIIDSSITNDSKNFTDSISELMIVHASLCDTVTLLNTAYGVVVLLITITCLIHLIITPYFLIMAADGRREPLRTAVQGLWCIFQVWRLLMIVQPTYATTIQIAGAVTTYLVILVQFQKEGDTKDNFINILKNATQMLKNSSTLYNFTTGRERL